MVGGDSVVTGEDQLEPAAETGPVNRGDDRLGQRLDPARELLALEAQPLRRRARRKRGELLDIGAGDERVGLARDEDRRPDRCVVAELDEQCLELHLRGRGELVHGLAGQVEGDDRDTVLDGGGERGHYRRSKTIARPIPPCAQIEIRPNCTSRRRISFASVVTSRAPVAPNGCPIAIEPPMTLVRSQSTSPTGPGRPSRSAQSREPHACTFESTCAAKAS